MSIKIGFTTDNLYSSRTQIQLSSLMEYNAQPEFILLHHAGLYNGLMMRYENYKKIFKEYRLYAIQEIFKRKFSTPQSFTRISASIPQYLTEERKKSVSDFLKHVKIYPCRQINCHSTIKLLKKLNPDIVVCNSGLVGKKVIETGINFLNIHTSKLPDYRGMNNIEWALWHNDPIFCTVHKIAKEIDSGDILFQEKISKEQDWQFLKTIEDCREYYFQQSYSLIGKTVKAYKDKNVKFVPQTNKHEPLKQYYIMHPILKEILQRKIEAQQDKI